MIKINLRQLLFDREMSQADLWRLTGGKKTGVRYNTINAYYHGYVKRMNVKDLVKICDALGCELKDLIEYTPDK